MAKKKKATPKRKTTRKRRISGAKDITSQLMPILLVAGGAIAGRVLSQKLSEQNEMLGMFAPLAAGVALPMFVKNPMMVHLGLGMAAAGALSLVNKYSDGKIGMIAGVSDESMMTYQLINGVDDGGYPIIGNGNGNGYGGNPYTLQDAMNGALDLPIIGNANNRFRV